MQEVKKYSGWIFIILGIIVVISTFIPKTQNIGGNIVTTVGGQGDKVLQGVALIGIGLILLNVTK